MPKSNKENVIKRAETKILYNIYYIYENLNAKKEIEKIKAKFAIPDDFYSHYMISKPSFNPEIVLNILLFDCITVWYHECLKADKIIDRIIRNIGNDKYKSFLQSNRKSKKKAKRLFVLQTLLFYFYDDESITLHEPMRINTKIWGQIISAKIFGMPQKNIISKLKKLTYLYLPSIDNNMRIQINELTGIEDLKLVWREKIINRQKKYSKKHRLIQNEKYLNHDRDKLAYELRMHQSKSREETKKILETKGFSTGLRVSYITRIVENYKNFIGED